MKTTILASQVEVNGVEAHRVYEAEPYLLYVNPYYVAHEFTDGTKYTKHYFMGAQRVACDMGTTSVTDLDPLNETEAVLDNLDLAFERLPIDPRSLEVTGVKEIREVYYGFKPTVALGTAVERVLYFYHPDYIGNTDMITDGSGFVHEFFTYNPCSRTDLLFCFQKSLAGPSPECSVAQLREGENLYHWKGSTQDVNSPYRFNGKELDVETGNYYYGARYYDPKVSVWLSVDPLADQRPNLTPYNFMSNNPVMRVDPNGLLDDWYQNNLTGKLEWHESDPGKDYTWITDKADLTFDFSSYIDGNSFDGMYGLADIVDFSGEKMHSSITLDFEEDANGNPIGSPEISMGSEIGKTFGLIEGIENSNLPNVESASTNGSNFSASLEKHSRVNALEGLGMLLTGQSVVDVGQRLDISGNNRSISFSASTNVYPSARLNVNGSRVMNYQAPSFYSTHGWWQKPSNSLYPRTRNQDW